MFLVADEPIEVQRMNILTLLKNRAERDGKSVVVQSGVLIVDNIAIFSLVKGNIRTSQPISNNGDR